MKLFKLLENLPSVPEEFVNQALLLENSDDTDISGYQRMMPGFQERTLIKNNQKFISARSKRYDLGSEFYDWVNANITQEYNSASVSVTPATSLHWGPHTDVTSKFNLIYVLQTGGNQCTTHWWYEKNTNPNMIPPPGFYINDYTQLQELDHLKMLPQTWYCIDQRYLHSVENLSSTRIALHIRLENIPNFV